jgi:hypothetical protein
MSFCKGDSHGELTVVRGFEEREVRATESKQSTVAAPMSVVRRDGKMAAEQGTAAVPGSTLTGNALHAC